mgnify:CR=1 FL=1
MSEISDRRFFIHIGMPKTGSTSLQEYFDRHRDELTRRDIAAVAKDHRRASEVFANELMRLDGKGFDRSMFPETWTLSELMPRWDGHSHCLYSSELLWAAGPNAVSVLLDLASENNSSVDVLAFFRSLDAWMWSWWAQETKASWIDWCDFLERGTKERRGYLSEVFGAWVRAESAVEIRVRPFDAPNLIQRFSSEIGIDDLEISPLFRSSNISEPRLEAIRRAALVKSIWGEILDRFAFKSFPLNHAAGARLVLETTEAHQVGYESAQAHKRTYPDPDADPTFGTDSLPLLADYVQGWCEDAHAFLGEFRSAFDVVSIAFLEEMVVQSKSLCERLRSASDPDDVSKYPQRGFADQLPTSAHEVALARGIAAAVVAGLSYIEQSRTSGPFGG